LLYLGHERRVDGNFGKHTMGDLSSAESLYRSVIAADAVLGKLNARERDEVRQNAACLAAYVRSKPIVGRCRPLELYGLNTQR
jgi:hypothetical protein